MASSILMERIPYFLVSPNSQGSLGLDKLENREYNRSNARCKPRQITHNSLMVKQLLSYSALLLVFWQTLFSSQPVWQMLIFNMSRFKTSVYPLVISLFLLMALIIEGRRLNSCVFSASYYLTN